MPRQEITFRRPVLFSLCVLLFFAPEVIQSLAQEVRESIRAQERESIRPRERMRLEMDRIRVPHEALRAYRVLEDPHKGDLSHGLHWNDLILPPDGKQKSLRERAASKQDLEKEKDQPTAQPDSGPIGYPNFDLPSKVEINQPFKIDVWITPTEKNLTGAARIYMEQTDAVEYDPRIFTVNLGERKTIQARILKSNAGLAQIIATGDYWGPIEATVNAGFLPILKSNLPDAVEGGSERAFELSFVDSRAKPVSLDAPVELSLRVSNLKMRVASNDPWAETVDLKMERGASASPLISIFSESYLRKPAVVTAAVKMNGAYTILDDTFHIEILPRWWVALLMSILGGLLHFFYETTKHWAKAGEKTKRKEKFLARLVVASISGAIGYFLASTNVVGIKLDTTSLRAFVILGFLFSYVGVDLVLKRSHWMGENSQEPQPP